MAKKSWGLIILGIVIFVVIVGVGVIGTFGYIVYRQMDVQTVQAQSPDQEFAKERARFEGQAPFIELPAGAGEGALVVHREQMAKEPTTLIGLRILAWGPRDRKLVRLTLPMWLLRLSGTRGVHLSNRDTPFDNDMSLNVTAEELERHGPGLILDFTTPHGERILIWAE
jgi:hypothetical protein